MSMALMHVYITSVESAISDTRTPIVTNFHKVLSPFTVPAAAAAEVNAVMQWNAVCDVQLYLVDAETNNWLSC